MNLFGWFRLALPLAIDGFAVGLVFGLGGLPRERWLRVALGFAAVGAVMMAAGVVARTRWRARSARPPSTSPRRRCW